MCWQEKTVLQQNMTYSQLKASEKVNTEPSEQCQLITHRTASTKTAAQDNLHCSLWAAVPTLQGRCALFETLLFQFSVLDWAASQIPSGERPEYAAEGKPGGIGLTKPPASSLVLKIWGSDCDLCLTVSLSWQQQILFELKVEEEEKNSRT